VLVAGCASPKRVAGPVIHSDTGLGRLSTTITGFSRARAQLLQGTSSVVAAAVALDAADAACATGGIDASSAARARARAATGKGRTALAALPAQLSAYGRAIRALALAEQATTSLSPAQRNAVQAVVSGGRSEAAATDAFRVAGTSAWPAYAQLDATESTWLDQRVTGWFRTQQEAANAYAVMREEGLPALQRARTLLQRVDAARRPVSDRESAALAAADTALASLRSTG
jgi:hypothetical protein